MSDSPLLQSLRALDLGRVENWLKTRAASVASLPYASVDLRHSGQRLVPVDTNVFPAGFNNLSATGRQRAVQHFSFYLRREFPQARRILIVSESHTRNQGYLDNLATLAGVLREAGLDVRIGRLDLKADETFAFQARGCSWESAGLDGASGTLVAREFTPDLILLNHDLTSGLPAVLEGIVQPVVPSPALGWFRRKKSLHFAAYDRIARDFSAEFGLDPWTICAAFRHCGAINFRERSGLECVALNVEAVLHLMREKYRAHGVADDPYVFVKADAGTYGMGIMTVRSGDDVLSLNKKTRNKMDVVKEGAQVHDVLIQEGVPTIDAVEGAFAEPVVYLVDGTPVGSVWRVNGERSSENNLNATGMTFQATGDAIDPAHGIVASLAALAAASEEAADPSDP